MGALRYEIDSGAIYHKAQVLELTPRELALLKVLMQKPGHAVTKERLFELVFPGETDVQYEAIEVVVYRLRKKLAGTGAALMTLARPGLPPARRRMKRPRMTRPASLRRTLLLGILAPVALFIVINSVGVYRQSLAAATTAYDRNAARIGQDHRRAARRRGL